MKRINQKNDVVIDTYYNPVNTNAEQGEVTEHYTVVSCAYFYKRQYIQEQEVFVKIELTKQMILDIADEIRAIEKEIVKVPYDYNPF
jgi:hypothetical protein